MTYNHSPSLSIEAIVSAVMDAIAGVEQRRHTLADVIARFRAEEMPERYSTSRSYESMLCK